MLDCSFFDTVLDGVFVVDSSNHIVYCNDVFGSISNVPARRLMKKPVDEVFNDNRGLLEQIRGVQAGQAHMPYVEMPYQPRGEEMRQIQVSAQAYHGHVLVYVRDVSLEALLHKKYKNELGQKEGLIGQLDRKVFELEFLLDTVSLAISQGENDFLKDIIMKRIVEHLDMEFILTYKRVESQPNEYEITPLQSYLADETGTARVRSHLWQGVKIWQEVDFDKAFAQQTCILQERADFWVVSTAVQSKNQDWSIFSYYYAKDKGDKARLDLKLLDSLTRQTFLLLENQELFRQSITDEKTKLYNQRYFKYRLDQEIKRSRKQGNAFALLVFDIDHFKKFNDTHGHLVGDQVLIEVARVIKSCFRATDITARFGGEEFVAICVETNADGAYLVAERARKAIESTRVRTADGQELQVTTSIGVSLCPYDTQDPEQLFELADQALYRAKKGGRNRTEMAQSKSEPIAQGS